MGLPRMRSLVRDHASADWTRLEWAPMEGRVARTWEAAGLLDSCVLAVVLAGSLLTLLIRGEQAGEERDAYQFIAGLFAGL